MRHRRRPGFQPCLGTAPRASALAHPPGRQEAVTRMSVTALLRAPGLSVSWRPVFFRDSHPLAGGAQPLGACPLPGKTFFFQACLVEGLIRTRGGERPSPRSEGLPRPLVSRLLPRTWVALMSVLPVSPEGPGVCSVWSWAPSHREAPPGGCSPHALPGSPSFGLGDPTPRFLGLLFL